MIKKLWPYTRGYRKWMLSGVLCSAAEAVFELLLPLVMADIVDQQQRQSHQEHAGQLGADGDSQHQGGYQHHRGPNQQPHPHGYRHLHHVAFGFVVVNMPIMMLITYGTIIAVMWYGAPLVQSGELEVGLLSTFFTYITQVLMSLMMVSDAIGGFLELAEHGADEFDHQGDHHQQQRQSHQEHAGQDDGIYDYDDADPLRGLRQAYCGGSGRGS